MKYIDAEKLIAEIERLYEIAREASYNGEIEGEMTAYDKILSFIASLQQEQTDLPSGEDVMTMCNQILIDWVKEGKTQKEKEQREQAHIRFFELYDDYLMREQPEVDLDSALTGFMGRYAYENSGEYPSAIDIARHFFELGLNARKEE